MGAPFPIDGAVPSAGNQVQGGFACAECFCGQVEAFPATVGLPAGWQVGTKRVQCPDCSRGEQIEPIPALAARGGHHGCRLIHNIIGPDAVVLRIYAGAKPVGATDDRPVHFLARAADLAELIDSLEAIKVSLEADSASSTKGKYNV